jgi:hypothetical protein
VIRMNEISALLRKISLQSLFDPAAKTFQDQEIVKGKVLKIYPNSHALLAIGKMKLTAAVEADIQAMKTYWFQTEVTESGIRLKLLFPEKDEGHTGRAILEHFRLPADNMASQLIDLLLENEIPFSKKDLALAINILQSFKGKAPRESLFQALLIAFEKKLPIAEHVIRPLLAVLDEKKLSQLLFQLDEMLNNSGRAEDMKDLNRNLFQLTNLRFLYKAEEVNQILRERNDTFSKQLLNKLEFWMKENPLAIKQLILNENSEQASLQPFTKDKADGSRIRQMLNAEEKNTLKAMFQQSIHNVSAQEVKQLLKTAIAKIGLFEHAESSSGQSEWPLKTLLIKYLQNMEHSSLRGAMERALDYINGQHFMREQKGPVEQFFIHVPIQLGEQWTDITIQINGKKDETEKINPNFCRIVFSLYLKEIKETVVDVFIQNRAVKVTIYNDILEESDIVQHLGSLQENLKQINYVLTGVSIQKGKTDEQTQKVISGQPYQKVDIKI